MSLRVTWMAPTRAGTESAPTKGKVSVEFPQVAMLQLQVRYNGLYSVVGKVEKCSRDYWTTAGNKHG